MDAPAPAHITELRMYPFKSYLNVHLPISPLTILIGRNASGKSNALDALEVFGRLARGLSVRDALDGTVDGLAPIRGGARGTIPAGVDNQMFKLGVTISSERYGELALDITVEVGQEPRIVEESLTQTNDRTSRDLIRSLPVENRYGSDIEARIWNRNRGVNPRSTFRSSQLLILQYAQRNDAGSQDKRLVLGCCDEILSTLLGVFHLDPVPTAMRDYVSARDDDLRRDASNISAVLESLQQESPETLSQIESIAKKLPEHSFERLDFAPTQYGDVMAGIVESLGGREEIIPAKQMSDGMLRMIAIATAVLGRGANLAIPLSPAATERNPTIIVEELENGLHPTQAQMLLDLIAESTGAGNQIIVTTHSPALLDALDGTQHRGVVVISRDGREGWTSVDQLSALPGYHRLMANETLGGAVQSGKLERAFDEPEADLGKLRSLLGIG